MKIEILIMKIDVYGMKEQFKVKGSRESMEMLSDIDER